MRNDIVAFEVLWFLCVFFNYM